MVSSTFDEFLTTSTGGKRQMEIQPVHLSGLGVTLEHPIMNAAGHIKTTEHVRQIVPSGVAAIMVGGITWEARSGNEGNVFHVSPRGDAGNSLGLPNPGRAYYKHELPEMVRIAHDHGKPLGVNINGFSPEEYSRLAMLCADAEVDWIEVNLGCPNIWHDSGQKPIASFHPGLIEETLGHLECLPESHPGVTIKLSPYSDPLLLAAVCGILAKSLVVGAVVSSNTFPNAFFFNEQGEQAIAHGQGLCGLSGPAMRHIAQGQIIQIRNELPDIDIIGVGGISAGEDVAEYLHPQVGAKAVQVGTHFFHKEDPRIFSDLLVDLAEL